MKKRILPLIFSTFSLAHPLQAADPVKEAVMAANSDPALRDAIASVIARHTRHTRLTVLELARQNSTKSKAPNSPSDKAENSSPTEALTSFPAKSPTYSDVPEYNLHKNEWTTYSDDAKTSSPTEASANPTANSLTKKNPTTRGKPFTVTYATTSKANQQQREEQENRERERDKRAQEKRAQKKLEGIIPTFFTLASSTQENIPQQGTKSQKPPSGTRQLFFTPGDLD